MAFAPSRKSLRTASWIVSTALAARVLTSPLLAGIASTQPTGTLSQADREAKQMAMFGQMKEPSAQRLKLLGDYSVLRDASKHAVLREKLIPLNRQIGDLEVEIFALRPPSTRPAPSPQEQAFEDAYEKQFLNSVMIALDDPATIADVQKQLTSDDPTIAGVGHVTMLQAQWLAAPDDASRGKAVDAVVAYLKSADVNDRKLGMTVRSAFYSGSATDEPIREAIAAAYPNKAVLARQAAWKQREKDKALQASILNKPMVIAGVTPDGKPFTTADWKGKVVLVDFWATWCGPCKESLPHVKEVYQKYHGQGLEIVGVSNDTSKAALDKFLAADPAMAWPTLFDAKAAADDQWNPVSFQFGVRSIPRMFLIDRNGICSTVTARQDMDQMIPKLLSEASTSTPVVK